MVNLAFRQSFLTLKNGDGAYVTFIAFYVVCCLVTWMVFMRQRRGDCLGSRARGQQGRYASRGVETAIRRVRSGNVTT